MRNIPIKAFFTLILTYVGFSFQFKAVSVSGTPLTINTTAQYTITAQRQYTQFLFNTPYNTQLVPSGSNLSIIFPQQYTLSGSENCDYIAYSFSFKSGFGCTVETANNKIIITNSITSD